MGGTNSKEEGKKELHQSSPPAPVERRVEARPVGSGARVMSQATVASQQQHPVDTLNTWGAKEALPQPIVHNIGPLGIPPEEVAKQYGETVTSEGQGAQFKQPQRYVISHAVPTESIRVQTMSNSGQKPRPAETHELRQAPTPAQFQSAPAQPPQDVQEFPVDSVEVPFNKAVKQPVNWKVKPNPTVAEKRVEAHEIPKSDIIQPPHEIHTKAEQEGHQQLPMPAVHRNVKVVHLDDPEVLHQATPEETKRFFDIQPQIKEKPKEFDQPIPSVPTPEPSKPIEVTITNNQAGHGEHVTYGPFDPSKPPMKEKVCGPTDFNLGPSNATKEDLEYLQAHAQQTNAMNPEIIADPQIPSCLPLQNETGIHQAAAIQQPEHAAHKPELPHQPVPQIPPHFDSNQSPDHSPDHSDHKAPEQ